MHEHTSSYKFVNFCPSQHHHLMRLKNRFGRETGNTVPGLYRRGSRYLRKYFKYRSIGVSVRSSNQFHEKSLQEVLRAQGMTPPNLTLLRANVRKRKAEVLNNGLAMLRTRTKKQLKQTSRLPSCALAYFST